MNLSASHCPVYMSMSISISPVMCHPPTSSRLPPRYLPTTRAPSKPEVQERRASRSLPVTSHILPLSYSLRAFLSWTLSRICNKVLSRRQEILEKSNNVMTILITFTVGAQLHICTASGSHWPRQEETIFTPGIQRLQTDVITLPIALFCCLFFL